MEPIAESNRLRRLERALLVLEGLTFTYVRVYAVFRRNTQSIKDRAYYLWEEAGSPAGQDQFFWEKAAAELTHSLRFYTTVHDEKDLKEFEGPEFFVQKIEFFEDDLPIVSDMYRITHSALGFCSNPHADWLKEIEDFEKMLKNLNLVDADKIFSRQEKEACDELL